MPQCPTPHKRRFSEDMANDELRHLQSRGRDRQRNKGLHTYACQCGYWHLGHAKYFRQWEKRSVDVRQSIG